MSEVKIKATCDGCGKELTLAVNGNFVTPPVIRSGLQPTGTIQVYRITSKQIQDFIEAKAKKYVPNVKVMVIPRYTEKKRRKNEPHRSYASLRIALSEEAAEKAEDLGVYGKIGDASTNVHFQKSLFVNLVRMYSYNMESINRWLRSYETLEDLEETLGITENFINDIKQYAEPQFVSTEENEKWIIFSAAAEYVISDMLTEVGTNTIPGKIQIEDVCRISKDLVEFTVYLHPAKQIMKENPHVRQILLGDEKPKK